MTRARYAGLILLALGAVAQASPPETYRERVDRYATAVERGDAQGFRSYWRRPGSVQLPGRAPIRIDDRTEAAALTRRAPNPGDRSRVGLLRDALNGKSGPARPDAQRLTRAILARDEFKSATRTPGELEKAWQRTWQQIARWLERLLGDRSAPTVPGGWNPAIVVRYTLVFLAVVVGLLAAIALIRTVLERRSARKPAPDPTGPPDLLALDIADPLSEAERHARAGAWRDAIRFVYIDALRQARDAGLLALAAHKTNGDYQTELASAAPDAARSLAPLTERFDRIWYGGESPAAAQLEAAREEARATVEHLRGPSA